MASAQVVARHLAMRGTQTLAEVVRGCSGSLPAGLVKQALMLLIQHNLAHAYTVHDEESRVPRPPVVVYRADVEAMVQIFRCATLLTAAATR